MLSSIANSPKRAGSKIELRDVTKMFGNNTVIDRMNLAVEPGEFLAMLGPSGSGKSTALMGIAGFEPPTTGSILIDGRDCTSLPPHKRNIGMVFQNYTLFPNMSVLENVAFPLKMRGVPKAERLTKARATLDLVRLGDFADRAPKQLSGGQQQRVAIARAIVYQPGVLLMDEPFSALDKNLREEMQLEIKRLHGELGMTIVFVTHDQTEALTIADRVAVLKDGRLQQVAPSRELYDHPANLFAASFIGEMNLIPATLTGGKLQLPGNDCWDIGDRRVDASLKDGKVTVAIRPQRLKLASSGGETGAATISNLVYAGADSQIFVRLPDGTEVRARVPGFEDSSFTIGAPVSLQCDPESLMIFEGNKT